MEKEQDKIFEIETTIKVVFYVRADNLKEAKAFASDYVMDLVVVDTNELNDVQVASKTKVKRDKVREVNLDEED